jgi:ABC-type nitrate/sulfonate/bicarbonate transport system permease component
MMSNLSMQASLPPAASLDQPRVTFLTERNTLRVASVVLLLLAWQIAGMMTDPYILPTPVAVAVAWWQLTVSGELITAAGASVFVFILGFALALALGIPLGIATGVSQPLRDFFDTYVTIFWSTPSIALLPLLIVWFGLTLETKLVLVFLSAFWPLVINTQVGIQNVEKSYIEVANAFGATRLETLRHVLFPASVPYLVAGIRIAVGRAIIGVIVAELFTSVTGLGARMTYYSNFFQVANYFAALLVFILFSVAATEAARLIEHRFNRWRAE